ncbi:hypothetical protein EDB81DRAFT_827029 [Dactylonectria macrodidyma]|uniref:Uncharacterized protein n=1 Tax=Dactylonectria macrodidyma TaxID=307937 RepID=A0A9P9D5A8_9HYPO|nr:hypothetical protein EDB81DRAFT_827029 [Dactylonectria macrodidyma]
MTIDYSKRDNMDTDSEPEISLPSVPTPQAPAQQPHNQLHQLSYSSGQLQTVHTRIHPSRHRPMRC